MYMYGQIVDVWVVSLLLPSSLLLLLLVLGRGGPEKGTPTLK